jgi:hypothetical protein
MSTVKLTELPVITHLDTNTSNTILVGVDLSSDVTSQFTLKTLSEGLYANNILNVGNNEILFPGVIGQFVGNNETYLQINLENNNRNGSSDYVATADIGTDTIHYIDLGIAGSNNYTTGFSSIRPLDGYLYVQGNTGQPGGNLIIGTNSTERDVVISIGGMNSENVFARFSTTQGFKLVEKPITFADGTTQNTSFTASGTYANGAFIQANAAFLVANTPDAIANSAALYANAAFLVANTPTHVANSAALYANGAFTKANSSFDSQNTTGTYANSAYTQANTSTSNAAGASLYANGAFAKANAALANSSGTFAGDLTITGNTQVQKINTGNLTVVGTTSVSGNADFSGIINVTGAVNMNATLVLSNSNFTATESAVTIKATDNIQTVSQAGTMLHISGKANTPARIIFDSFSIDGSAYGIVAGRTARGTVSSPTATGNNDILMRVAGNGWGTTGFAPLGVARIDIVASENYSDTARGSRIEFYNVRNGTNTVNKIASFNADTIDFTGTVSPEKGFIYVPRMLGAQTAITIDFATDSMIRATFSSTLTMSFANYTYGKVVEAWVTNTAGNGQTINLGVLANNSTTGSTTLTVASQRSAKLQYFSVDGDLANTFCAITYA